MAEHRSDWSGLDRGTAISMQLLSGIVIWGGGGWLLDRWLDTTPWLFGVGVLLGFGAGLYLVWLRSEEPRQLPTAPDHGPGPTTDTEG